MEQVYVFPQTIIRFTMFIFQTLNWIILSQIAKDCHYPNQWRKYS
jgi:hypothetical protein